jgi:hypothetical protein
MFPIFFVKKETKFVKNNSLYIDQTWKMENTKFGQLANYFSWVAITSC